MAARFNDESADVSNFSDVRVELQKILDLIQDDEKIPLVSLEEAVKPLISIVPELEQMVSTVKKARHIVKDGLTNDESTSISLYSIDWKPRDKSFHVILNTTLQKENRKLLKPWFHYLKLIMTALTKLSSDSTRLTVYHAVKLNLIAQYPMGRTFVWWSFTRCTMSLDVLNNEYILGQNGARTLFIIDSQSGKSIREHSFYPNEEDVLLPPACQFQITGCFNAGNGLYIIHLKEISSKYQFINPALLLPTSLSKTHSTVLSLKQLKPGILSPPHQSPIFPQLKEDSQQDSSSNQFNPKRIQKTSNKSTMPKQRNITLKRIDPKVQKIIDILESDPTSTTLDLPRCQIGDYEAKIIANTLLQNKTLTTLNLQYNLIGSQGAQYLANALRQNTTLKIINLEGNQIGDRGAQYLANGLLQNNTLTAVNLRSNQIRIQGAQHLSNTLQQNKALTTLNLQSNLIGNLGARYIANGLQKNKSVTTLHLESNRITAQGAQYLASALQLNKTLAILDLESNQIGPEGAQYLANALKQNKTLTMLNLEGNQIGTEGKRHIMESSKNNPDLKISL